MTQYYALDETWYGKNKNPTKMIHVFDDKNKRDVFVKKFARKTRNRIANTSRKRKSIDKTEALQLINNHRSIVKHTFVEPNKTPEPQTEKRYQMFTERFPFAKEHLAKGSVRKANVTPSTSTEHLSFVCSNCKKKFSRSAKQQAKRINHQKESRWFLCAACSNKLN